MSYMTGIDIELITSKWLSLEKISGDIKDFFWPDTVVIGQNISFDIGFLKKFFPWNLFKKSIDTYTLANSSIPYLKSYSLESIDSHLENKYRSYQSQKENLNSELSKWKTLSSHDALYDCINGLCFIGRWLSQVKDFWEEYSIINTILSKTQEEWIISLIKDNVYDKKDSIKEKNSLPVLVSPIGTEKKIEYKTSINRDKQEQHSKRSTRWLDLQQLISELPHPCIIAVSHGSKIDIIKKACKENSFDYLKEEQIFDQEKLSLWLKKTEYTEEEFLFIVFYLSHYRDGYRIMQWNNTIHKHIIDYLQAKSSEVKNNKKILCTHGGLYNLIHTNEHRQQSYKDYPICLLDADRRHTTYNDYGQRGIALSSLLYQREKFEYIDKQDTKSKYPWKSEIIETILSSLSFFIAHFSKESEKQYKKTKQYKREINYIIDEIWYKESVSSRKEIQILRNKLQEFGDEIPKYIGDLMWKIETLFHNPLKIQRNINQNKDISYSISPAVRYIDFAEYLRMFGNHKLMFFSPHRPEYKEFATKIQSKKITTQRKDNIEEINTLCKWSEWSVFIICHNTDKSKKIFNLLHNNGIQKTHNLVGEYLTWWIARNAIKKNNSQPSIIIGGYHMLLHFRWEGNIIEKIIICYVPQNISTFIESDINQYAITS